MLPKVINGYTVIASEWKALEGVYVILGARTIGPLTYEYVTAKMASMDDSEWFWGNYFAGSASALADALVDMAGR